MKKLSLIIVLLILSGCSSPSLLPDKENVKMSRKAAADDCKPLGKVSGTVMSVKGTAEQALQNMEQDAANKGANYVVIGQYSETGTSVTGTAFNCP